MTPRLPTPDDSRQPLTPDASEVCALNGPSERSQLEAFVRESNRIEGILRDPTTGEIEAHERFLALWPAVEHVERFVCDVEGRPLRDRHGLDVRVGLHFPPPGGPQIRADLKALLSEIQAGALNPYEAHVAYEQLHPFVDGNGRSGRVLWAWHMQRDGMDPFALPFLHRFYYQALDASRFVTPREAAA